MAVSDREGDPVFHDDAQLAINLHLVDTVAAGADDPGALANEGAVLVRPFDDLDVSSGLSHDRDSSMARRTSVSRDQGDAPSRRASIARKVRQ